MRVFLAWTVRVSILIVGATLSGQEIAVPKFDTENAPASYILAVPPAHDPKKLTPLILDFHGAAAPERKGANVTNRAVWSKFVKAERALVLGLNSRTRAWNMIEGERDDSAYALHVLDEVRQKHALDPQEVYLAGFSSGSDFLCRGGLQLRGKFAGSLVVCPGPPNVVGIRGGELLRVKDHPFYFLTGEQDYIRKSGAWAAYLTLAKTGARVMYREVPDVGHRFPPTQEYVRGLHYLRLLAGRAGKPDHRAIVAAALKREDYLLASTHADQLKEGRRTAVAKIEAFGTALLREAESVSWADSPGRAYETWWRLMTQFHRFPALARRAKAELHKDHGITNRDMYKARREYFQFGGRRPRTVTPVAEKWREGAAKQDPKEPLRPEKSPRPNRQGAVKKSVPKSPAAQGLWSFDRYLDYDELTVRVRSLAAENPERVRLHSMGKSVQGRDLWVCEITAGVDRASHKPAVYVQGGIHGNEISSVMVTLYLAWQMGANPDRRRGIDRSLRDTTFYVAPTVNPDASHDFVTQPNSHWRPRFNFRPHDADGDGKVDEDGYEDIDGDGEISQMYVLDPQGPFILKDGRMRRPSRAGDSKATEKEENKENKEKKETEQRRFRHVGREGLDNDGDGKFSEDPIGGVNLNRNFPFGFRPRKDFEGYRGKGPASEPETAAIVGFVRAHANICLFFDYHNAASCVFYWVGPDGQTRDAADFARMTAIAGRAKQKLGFVPRPLDHEGVGLSIAWVYGELGIPAAIVELEVGDPKAWGGDVFVPAKKFKHPQLGDVWIGNDDKKLPKRNPPPAGIYEQARRHWDFMRFELKELPKLELEQPRIVRRKDGYAITGFVANTGKSPMESARSKRLGKVQQLTISAQGAQITGTTTLPALDAGERRAFEVRLTDPQESVTLVASHPRGGTFELPVLRPRVATAPIRALADYRVAAGYETLDRVQGVDLRDDKGPAFRVPHAKQAVRVAVLLGEFADLRHMVPADTFRESLFGDDYTGTSFTGQSVYGSVRAFYREMSYGKMDVTGRVFDWCELPGKFDDYRKASFGSSKFRDALEKAVLAKHGPDALDGFDGMIFVWAGNPVRRVSCLWPMRVPLKHRPGVIAFKTGEFYKGQMAPIGVACHEMGHTFGVNDKYGLGAPEQPMGRWCLMCKGTHGSGESMQHRPFHLCAWCKMVIGWVQPTILDAAQLAADKPRKFALRPLSSSPKECLRILLKPDGSVYLLLSNRRREGFLTELPSAGLVILRVGPKPGTPVSKTAPQKQVQLMAAHGLGPARRGELQKLDRIAWPQPGKTEWRGGGVRISAIRREEDVVYFEVGRDGK